jgi:hypothetical protein
MRHTPSLFAILFLPTACAFGSGPPEPVPGPLEWPEGEFALLGSVQYSRATGISQSTATETYEATLVVGEGDYMALETTAGMCITPNDQNVQRQLDRGYRTFSCGGASYRIQPAGSLVSGTLSVTVPTVRRDRGRCIAYGDDGKTCLEYSYEYREDSKRVQTNLRVRKVR